MDKNMVKGFKKQENKHIVVEFIFIFRLILIWC